MIILTGKSVCGGYAFGKLAFYDQQKSEVKRIRITDTDGELTRYKSASNKAISNLKELFDKALKEVGEVNAQIFEVHQMMLEDEDYVDSITNIITTQEVNAEYAVAITSDNFSQMFSSMDDEYMKERAADVKDISERVIRLLCGFDEAPAITGEPIILAADDLAPSETVQFDKDKILAFVTMHGSTTSHTAILARMMSIPAIIGLENNLTPDFNGEYAIVDGYEGKVYINPDSDTIAKLQVKADSEKDKKRQLELLKGKGNITLDGHKIDIFANIGGVGDVASALQNDAGGIGLFRSEFLYLQTETYPTENEQFFAYKTVAETMAGKKVVIRTLDIGADKQIGYFNLDKEENPAMGFRAIRICLERQHIFKTQLRALYRASAYGNIAIMFPMITDVEEVLEIKQIVNHVKSELIEQGIPFSENVELGIMIETPAAVMVSDLLAKEVDFFSVGTNDLTQYLLAVDRQNPYIERFYRPHHRGLLRCLKIAADNAHKEGKWIGICGELASDIDLTETFLAIGIDELSVSPGRVFALREKVRSIDLSKVKERIISTL